MSKYEKYREEIVNLQISEGVSAKKAARILSERYGLNFGGFYDYVKSKKLTNASSNSIPYSQLSPDNVIAKELESHKLDGNSWKTSWIKTNELSIKVHNDNLPSYEVIKENLLNEIKNHEFNYKKIKRTKIEDPHALVIDIADLHIGKYASYTETGNNYNVDIALDRAIKGVEGLLQKSIGYNIDKIFFVIGNDILHTDTTRRTTTSGTPQDTHGQWHENFLSARKLYIEVIELLLGVADVHVVHCPSNHDYQSGYYLASSIECWFRKSKNVTFDVGVNHRKYIKYGVNLIGLSHGDGAKTDKYPLLMAAESKEYWANTDFRYMYLHHIHHKDVKIFNKSKDFIGVNVEYLRSPSGSDGWHHRNGYCENIKAIEGFIHSYDYGQVAKLSHNFKA